MFFPSSASGPGIVSQIVFWGSFSVLAFTYLGYPVVLFFLARVHKRPAVVSEPHEPTVSLLVPARNEARHIEAKIRNACEIDYPPDKMETIVVDDASADDTLARARSATDAIAPDGPGDETGREPLRHRIRIVHLEESHGKAMALNRAAREARGEILVFSDADSLISPHSLRLLVRPFADPAVGCVAGRYFAGGVRGRNVAGVSVYWRYENYLRRKESDLGGLLGASGALYAVRRSLYEDLPPSLINDDFVVPMRVGAKGYRTVYEPSATALEDESRNSELEFGRRVRIMAGNCQHLWLFRNLVRHRARWRLVVQLLCHKFLRVVSPLWLIALFASNLALAGEPLYATLLAIQTLFYALALVGRLVGGRYRLSPVLTLPYYFTMVNAAALAGMYYFLFNRRGVAWKRETAQPREVPDV